jgi:hypothetical protein
MVELEKIKQAFIHSTQKIEKLTNDKEFINEFTSTANSSFMFSGGYDDVYEQYENKLSDGEILTLLNYCEKNDLLED